MILFELLSLLKALPPRMCDQMASVLCDLVAMYIFTSHFRYKFCGKRVIFSFIIDHHPKGLDIVIKVMEKSIR